MIIRRFLPVNLLCNPMIKAKDIIKNLVNLSSSLVFCDDSDIQGQPNVDFVSDIRVLYAIQIESSNYGKLDLLQLLIQHQKKELHTADIVNPSKKSEWYGVDPLIRIGILNHAKQLLLSNVERIYYCYISMGQYNKLRKEAEKHSSVNAKIKTGLKKVFLRSLLKRLESLQKSVTLVLDQDKATGEPIFESQYKQSFLEGGAPITADSSFVQGLQLADFAAWTITRYVRKRKKLGEGKDNQFDMIASEFLAKLPEKIEYLLKTRKENNA